MPASLTARSACLALESIAKMQAKGLEVAPAILRKT